MRSSSWQCNAHQARVNSTRVSNEHLRGEWSSTIEWSFDETPQFLVDACAEYSANEPRSCDGRAMTFEIPEAGFRLIFQSLVKEWFEYDLEIRLQFLQTDSTGLGGSKRCVTSMLHLSCWSRLAGTPKLLDQFRLLTD